MNWGVQAAFCKVASVLNFNTDRYGVTAVDGGTTTADQTMRDWTFYGNAQLDTAQYKSSPCSLALGTTGDYIATAYSNDFALGTQNFTVEMWLNPSKAAVMRICGQGASAGTTRGLLIFTDATMHPIGRIYDSAGTVYDTAIAAGTMSAAGTTWYHLCLERTGGTMTTYLDGAVYGTANVSGVSVNNSTYPFALGQLAGSPTGANFSGWIDDFYMLKGEALHGGTFTPPTGSAPRSTTDLVWTDVTSDTMMRAGVSAKRGISGADITDKVAQTGVMSLTLNNDGKQYSPDSASCRAGWDIGTRMRFYLLDGTTPTYKFTGRVSDIEPDYGIYRDRGVSVSVVDYMEIPATYKTRNVSLQTAQRPDQLINTIVSSLSIAPTATNYIQDTETYGYAFHTEQDEKSTGMNVMQKIAQSSLGYIYVTGDDTLTYEPRFHRFLSVTPEGTLTDTMTGLVIKRGASMIYNTIKDTIYPVLVGTDLVVLASAASPFSIPPGGTVTKTYRYRDPNSGQSRVSGYGMVTPVSGTDYRFSVSPSGMGNDAAGSVTVSVSFGANASEAQCINAAPQTIHCNLFEMRGYMISVYDPVEVVKEDAASQISYGERTKTFSQPYQTSTNYADSLVTWLLSKYKNAYSDISEVTFVASGTYLESLARSADISSRIKIVETQTGVNTDFSVNQVSYKIDNGILTTSYLLEPAEMTTYWILEDVTYGVLDTTTLPGP